MKPTQQELADDKPTPDTLQSAIQQVRNNGYVLLDQALPQEFIGALRSAFAPLLEAHVAEVGPNVRDKLNGVNHYNMYLPFVSPFNDERVVANSFALPIIQALLGEECVCHYFASNIAFPGSTYQVIHADIVPLFPETMPVLPPYSVVLNIPLVDFREDNGPLEVWPGGTHHHVASAAQIPTLAAGMHSQRVLMPAGSVLIRDSRMWHRGTPNRSNEPRPNLALVYSRSWLKLQRPQIEISRAAHDGLSERAQKLFRFEKIGAPALREAC
ncbi:MAG: phytanoyl-CoA dioxygenase family protein [Steroidobacteraceae bacterium]